MSVICLKNVLKARDAGYRLVIRDFSVDVGEHVAITGSSGCGKSTTLDILGMVLRPDSADTFHFTPYHEPTAQQIDIAALWAKNRTDTLTDIRRQFMGYVLQTGELFPFLTVEENILLTALVAGAERTTAKKKAEELLEELEIARLRHAMPATLSIGERQRTAIARALASEPRLLLADEPTAALDPGLSRTVMRLFLKIARERHTAVVMVSHDVALVHEFAFRETPLFVQKEGDRITAWLGEQSPTKIKTLVLKKASELA